MDINSNKNCCFIRKSCLVVFLIQLIVCLSIPSYVLSAVLDNSMKRESSKFIRGLTKLTKESIFAVSENVKETTQYANDKSSENIMDRLLLRESRSVDDNVEIQIIRSPESVDFNIPCGSCRKKLKRITITKPGCSSTTRLLPSCAGLCESWEIPHYEPPYFKKSHPVCQPLGKPQKVRITLRCRQGVNNVKMLDVPRACHCFKCNPSTTACNPLY